MAQEPDFDSVIKTVKITVFDELQKLSESAYSAEILINTNECFRISIEWNNCIGEIIVEKPYFAPYRFVKIEILSLTADDPLIFFWGDSEGDSLQSIVMNIQRGIVFANEY